MGDVAKSFIAFVLSIGYMYDMSSQSTFETIRQYLHAIKFKIASKYYSLHIYFISKMKKSYQII